MCKFYQGPEDRVFEKQLKVLFEKVHRLKPESSRSVRLTSPRHCNKMASLYSLTIVYRSHGRLFLLLWLGSQMPQDETCLISKIESNFLPWKVEDSRFDGPH